MSDSELAFKPQRNCRAHPFVYAVSCVYIIYWGRARFQTTIATRSSVS